jgi:hypothetical protein
LGIASREDSIHNRFVNFTRHIDRLKNALPVAPVLSRFHDPTFFFKILDRLVDPSSNALSSFCSIFTV